MFLFRFATFCISIPVIAAGQGQALSNAEIFDRIHKSEVVSSNMEPGSFEFRLYREWNHSSSILLEYLSETGKIVIYDCDSNISKVKMIDAVQSRKNNLEKVYLNRVFRYSGSYNSYFLDH